jgi:hypothetical protein
MVTFLSLVGPQESDEGPLLTVDVLRAPWLVENGMGQLINDRQPTLAGFSPIGARARL